MTTEPIDSKPKLTSDELNAMDSNTVMPLAFTEDGSTFADRSLSVKDLETFIGKTPGPEGQPGNDGNDGRGISNIAITNNDLIITYTDGTSVDLGRVTGLNGAAGEGIARADITGGELQFVTTTGRTLNVGQVVGQRGRGVSDALITSGGDLSITYTDGTTVNLGNVKGADGTDGQDGAPGADGTSFDSDGDYTLTGDITFEGTVNATNATLVGFPSGGSDSGGGTPPEPYQLSQQLRSWGADLTYATEAGDPVYSQGITKVATIFKTAIDSAGTVTWDNNDLNDVTLSADPNESRTINGWTDPIENTILMMHLSLTNNTGGFHGVAGDAGRTIIQVTDHNGAVHPFIKLGTLHTTGGSEPHNRVGYELKVVLGGSEYTITNRNGAVRFNDNNFLGIEFTAHNGIYLQLELFEFHSGNYTVDEFNNINPSNSLPINNVPLSSVRLQGIHTHAKDNDTADGSDDLPIVKNFIFARTSGYIGHNNLPGLFRNLPTGTNTVGFGMKYEAGAQDHFSLDADISFEQEVDFTNATLIGLPSTGGGGASTITPLVRGVEGGATNFNVVNISNTQRGISNRFTLPTGKTLADYEYMIVKVKVGSIAGFLTAAQYQAVAIPINEFPSLPIVPSDGRVFFPSIRSKGCIFLCSSNSGCYTKCIINTYS